VDLNRFLQVLARFRVLVLCGLALAISLAFVSYVRVSFENGKPTVSYRSNEQWASYTRVLLTQPGFKWGNSYAGASEDALSSQAAVEGRLPDLANLYSSLVTSDNVRRIMLRQGPFKGGVSAAALPAGPSSSAVLPIINIRAIGFTARSSVALANRARDALRAYVDEQQQVNGVPPRDRIRLAVLNTGFGTELVQPRKKILPVVIFLAVMFATVTLALTLENVRPRVATVGEIERLERVA
jgi:hypothetical protein